MNLTTTFQMEFRTAIQRAFPEYNEIPDKLVRFGREGTYTWTGAPQIGKALKINAKVLAETVAANFVSAEGAISGITNAGIIHVAVKADALARRLDAMHNDDRLGVPLTSKRERVVIDFSSPNVAKELHVGHLRSTIIGESLSRTLEFLGHDVLRLNHLGDWGTQFGMLICYLKANQIDVAALDLTQLMGCYRESKKLFDTDKNFQNASRAEVVSLQGGSPESRAVWEQICQVSRTAFQEIYDMLDVTLIERGESYYNDKLEAIVQDFLVKGFAKISEGAVCVFEEDMPTPFMLKKSDGGYTYDTTDIAALYNRIYDEGGTRLIYVVDAGQSDHLLMLKKIGIRTGIINPEQTEFVHVAFGVVQGADGKKYKTRSGDVALLKDLIQESIEKATKVFEEKGIQDEESARILGLGALKYADLKNTRQKDYVFNPDQMLSFDGDTAVFILYSLVRIHALKQKIAKPVPNVPFELNHESERALGLHIVHFGEVLEIVEKLLEPHHLSDFLYQLACKFNGFYRDCKTLDSPEEASRLRLCDLTERVGKKGLSLLGIKTLEKM